MTARVDLDELSQLGDLAFIEEMIALFAEVAPRYLREVQRAADAEDAAGLARAAHTLRGACLGLFAETMADLSASIEREAAHGALATARALIPPLTVAHEETQAALRSFRPG